MDHFEHSGLKFEVRDDGPSDGDAVVLLHGFPQDPSSFDAVVPLLHEHGLRTLVPSQRGYTHDARPPHRRDYAMAEVVGDVVALLDAAGVGSAHVVGHDWGGAQAWALAARHPGRVTSLTVLSTPHPAAMQRSFVTSTQGLRSWYMAFFQLPAVPEALVSRTLRRTLTDSHLPAEHVERYTSRMADREALSGALGWYRAMPFSMRQPAGRVTVPTTYLWGRYDFALGRTAAELTGVHVDAPYVFRPLTAGHWLPETNPRDVADAVLEHARG